MKVRKTGLQILKKIFDDWMNERYLIDITGITVCILGEQFIPYEYLQIVDAPYHYTFSYVLESKDMKAEFRFRMQENPLQLKEIEREILNSILMEKRRKLKDPMKIKKDEKLAGSCFYSFYACY